MIYIVSGLPRSGTSLMMQMLQAGGVPVLSDGVRSADEDNPRGYLEWEPVKRLPKEPELIGQAEGKVVKVISSLLSALSAKHQYRVLFMDRPVPEVSSSQAVMIQRRGTGTQAPPPATVQKALQAHKEQTIAWLSRQAHIAFRIQSYHDLLEQSLAQADEVAQFLDLPLNLSAMAAEVHPGLHRQRTNGG